MRVPSLMVLAFLIFTNSASGVIEEELEKHYIARLTGLSISMMEFGAAIVNSDESYTGKYRAVIERRRKWLVERNQPLAEGA